MPRAVPQSMQLAGADLDVLTDCSQRLKVVSIGFVIVCVCVCVCVFFFFFFLMFFFSLVVGSWLFVLVIVLVSGSCILS